MLHIRGRGYFCIPRVRRPGVTLNLAARFFAIRPVSAAVLAPAVRHSIATAGCWRAWPGSLVKRWSAEAPFFATPFFQPCPDPLDLLQLHLVLQAGCRQGVCLGVLKAQSQHMTASTSVVPPRPGRHHSCQLQPGHRDRGSSTGTITRPVR